MKKLVILALLAIASTCVYGQDCSSGTCSGAGNPNSLVPVPKGKPNSIYVDTANPGDTYTYNFNTGVWSKGSGSAPAKIASGSLALATNAIASAACQTVTSGSVNSATATGVLTTDTITFTPNGSIKAVTGYVPATTGGLTVTAYPTAGFVNFDVCNWTAGSVTPGAVTLNWAVIR